MASNSISFGGTNSGVQVGINHGPIYPPIERPETPPAPLSTCPFRRDPDFVDRGALLEEIYQKGCAPAARIALVGLGGVGKSQLAIECCYRIEERSAQTWIFWIHAANAERFEKSCWDMAHRLKIPERNNPKAKVFQLIHNWLLDRRNGKWVVILDNVDDSRFLHEIPTESNRQDGRNAGKGSSLLEYLPVTNSGSIIITSRSRDAIESIVEPSDMISIGPMNESDAAELFARKLGDPATQDAKQLIEELDFMPLAIVQAAVHIRHRAPRLSVSQYLRKFQQNDRERIRLLNHEKGQLRRDKEAKASILVTWQISFDHIQRVNPSAADVLSLMCLFDRQGIPETLLRCYKRDMNVYHDPDLGRSHNGSDILRKSSIPSKEVGPSPVPIAASILELGSEISSANSTEIEFEESISTLRDYSMIFIGVDDAAFAMHRLVQLAMRQWLEDHSQLEQWKECFTDILLLNFPTKRWEKWDVCQLLLPHVFSAVMQMPTKARTLHKWAQLVHATAAFTLDKGNYARSEELATLAFDTRASLLGPQDERTIHSLDLMGWATQHQGKWKNAEHVHRKVIDIFTQISGPESLATLSGMNNLARLYWEQDRWNEAEEIQLQILEIRKRIMGLDHPDTLACMKNLALNYQDQGRWNEAEKVEMQIPESRRRIMGPEHPGSLTSIGNLESVYQKPDQWDEAEKIELQVLENRRQFLGPEHPRTLSSMGNLGSIYQEQGRWDEAERVELQALEIRGHVLGPEHPKTLSSMARLARTYWNQGRWNEAGSAEIQVLTTRERILGPGHPDTLKSMNNYARTLWALGEQSSAIHLMADCVQLRIQILGPEHPGTIDAARTLDEWYEINELPSAQVSGSSTQASGETSSEVSPVDKHQKSPYSFSKEGYQPSSQRKRAIFSWLFRRS